MAHLLGTVANRQPLGRIAMAKTQGMLVPPSLIDQFLKNLVPSKGLSKIRVRPSVRIAEQRPEPSYTTRFISFAAAWLTAKWTANASKVEESQFYSAVWQEMRAGVFNPAYWQELTPSSDLAEYATPTVTDFDRSLPAQYNDPAHQPSICTYKNITRTYPTPADNGTPENPATGWAGATLDQVWRDLYHVQRKLVYSLPTVTSDIDDRPIAVHVEMTIAAAATQRGNRNWFAFAVERYLHRAVTTIEGYKGAITHWAPEDWYKFQLPPESAGQWDATISRKFLDSARHKAHLLGDNDMRRLTLRIATPPSMGMYGSRNDEAQVIHHETVKVYWAK